MAETVGADEGILFIKARIEAHDFNEFTDEENIAFSYEVLRWLHQSFRIKGYGGDGIHSSRDGFNGALLPDPIKPLVTYEWDGTTHYRSENEVSLKNIPEAEVRPGKLPIFQVLRDQGMNYPAIIEHLRSNPDLCADIEYGTMYLFDRYEVDFNSGLMEEWGLSFRVSPDDISVLPYGKKNSIRPALDFMLANLDRQRVLCRATVGLGVLAVSGFEYRRYVEIPIEMFDRFDSRLNGEDPVPQSTLYLGRSIEEAVIKTLIREGIIIAPKEMFIAPD